jgi:UDP-N-acetylmuramoyl-L-alanyl-D-glutamate--2,6-diaminopimelate ligase
MRLRELVAQLGGETDVRGTGPEVRDVRLDSRDVTSGCLFAALPGLNGNGARFTSQAAERGATAVLMPKGDLGSITDGPLGLDIARWVHPDARRVAGLAAALVHGRPTRAMSLCGITGTNGKTTTAHILGHLLQHAGLAPAVLGTAGHTLADGVPFTATHTTPDAPSLQRLLARHRDLGGRTAALEVSSHALEQERVAGLDFRVAVFMNLSREHDEYHGGMEAYAAAKARLFSGLSPDAHAVIHLDDPYGERMAEAARSSGARVITFSTRRSADLRASGLRTDLSGSQFDVDGMGIFSSPVRFPLRGRYNAENAMAAAAAARLMGASPSSILEGLATTLPAPGRLEPVPTSGRPFSLFVDYAHSPDALERVLATLREDLTAREEPGRLIVVFGCGGDRDRGKRPEMGAIAARLADVQVVTTDNPRGEAPARIADEILAGMPRRHGDLVIELDRRRAIRCAVAMAEPGDVVLVAGKGHETTQVIGADTLVFDDRAVAREALV